MMNYHAEIEAVPERHYAALRRELAQQDIPKELPPLIEVLKNLLNKENIKTNGACFFRYLSSTRDGQMVIDVGFPIEQNNSKPGNIEFGSFPPGKYLSVTHPGDYRNLREAHMYLESYAKAQGLTLDESASYAGITWGCRAEIYLSDPHVTPIEDWETEVIFLLK